MADHSDRLLRSHQIVTSLARLNAALATLNAEARAALLLPASSGERLFVKESEVAIPAELERLDVLVADNPRQAQEVGRLQGLVRDELATLERRRRLRETEGLERAVEALRQDESAADHGATRTLVARLLATEDAVLHDRRDGTASAELRCFVIDLGAMTAIIAAGGVAFVLIRGALAARHRHEGELKEMRSALAKAAALPEHHAQEIRRLGEMGSLFQSCNTLDEIFDVVSRNVPEVLPYDAGALYVATDESEHLRARAVWGRLPPTAKEFAAVDCWALRRGLPHSLGETDSGPGCRHLGADESTGTLCVPMVARGEVVGTLCLNTPRPGDDTWPTTLELAKTVSEQISLALSNLRLQDRLREQSVRDALTGLFNRRYLEESLEREMKRALRHGRPLGVIVADLDHFKEFNTRFGHAGGDAVLRAVATTMRAHIRGDDIACRYGGEEFVLILPESSLQAAAARAEALRQIVSEIEMEHHGRRLDSVHLSFGVAAFPDHGTTGAELLKTADEALFRAKSSGRDCVRLGTAPATKY